MFIQWNDPPSPMGMSDPDSIPGEVALQSADHVTMLCIFILVFQILANRLYKKFNG